MAPVPPPQPTDGPPSVPAPTQAQSSALDRSLASPPDPGTGTPVETPPQPAWPRRPAQLRAEYISAGGYTFLSSYLRSLPHFIDDVTRDLGDDLYERMLLDPQVNSSLRLLKLAALSSGVRLEPAVELDNDEWEGDDDPEQVLEDNQPRSRLGRFRTRTNEELLEDVEDAEAARKKEQAEVEGTLAADIADFCTRCLDNLERPLLDVLYEMLDGLAFGAKVAEQVYDLDKDDDGKDRLILKSLKVKPRTSTAFVVDAYMNTVGLLGLLPGKGYPVVTGSVIGDPGKIPNLLPRDKFAVFTWAGKDGDPRGSSLLRPVYNAWWLKMQIWGEYAKFLARFAAPALVGTTGPDAVAVPQTDALGNVIPGAPLITPEQSMLNGMAAFRNSSMVAIPHGSNITPLNAAGEAGALFKDAIGLFNQEISKGILCQTLATEEGLHMAKAASETHQDVLDLVIYHVKQTLAAMVRHDILFPLVRYNWGIDVAKRLTPKVHLAQTQQHNWAKDASAISALAQAQYLDPSQYAEMDARIGLPKRKKGAAPPPDAAADPNAGGPPAGPPAPGGGKSPGTQAPAAGGPAAPPAVAQAEPAHPAVKAVQKLVDKMQPATPPAHPAVRAVQKLVAKMQPPKPGAGQPPAKQAGPPRRP